VKWNIGVLVGGSQKALMLPQGLAAAVDALKDL